MKRVVNFDIEDETKKISFYEFCHENHITLNDGMKLFTRSSYEDDETKVLPFIGERLMKFPFNFRIGIYSSPKQIKCNFITHKEMKRRLNRLPDSIKEHLRNHWKNFCYKKELIESQTRFFYNSLSKFKNSWVKFHATLKEWDIKKKDIIIIHLEKLFILGEYVPIIKRISFKVDKMNIIGMLEANKEVEFLGFVDDYFSEDQTKYRIRCITDLTQVANL